MLNTGPHSRPRSERGAVMVLVAIMLPLFATFAMFAIDVAHWFDYSRNLQNRADAAALAGGLAYGGTCATTTPSQTAMDGVSQAAQQYGGGTIASDMYWPAASTHNLPNLNKGLLDRNNGLAAKYHVLFNSTNYWTGPGKTSTTQSFTMGNVCNATDEDGNTGSFLDVKVSQDHIPLLLPLVNINPTITAHARVALEQGTFENNIRPIAVRDPAATPCVSVRFVNANTNAVIKTVTLTKDAAGDPNFASGTLWDNLAGDTVQMPAAANVYVQPFLNNCSGSGDSYDSDTNSGLNVINVASASTPAATQPPAITTGGVVLTGCISNTGAFNQYFTSTDCTTGITANVAFAPNVPLANQKVDAVDTSTNTTYPLTHTTGATCAPSADCWHTDAGPTIAAGSGRHPIQIIATQTAGSIGTGNQSACGPGPGNPKPCKTDLGVQQQAFGACNDCDPPDDSGPIVAVRLRLPGPSDPPQASGRNQFAAGSNPTLVVEVTVQGLHFDAPGQKATVLRPGVQTDHATGLVDCGQGNGASADSDAITNGCPLVGTNNCKSTDFCAPLKIYDPALHPNGVCDPELRETANAAFADCVQATSGQRRNKIPGSIAKMIVKNGTCSPNAWPAYSNNPQANPIPAGDPRAITLIITAPADLSQNVTVPIRNFAVFYVTGWDTGGSIPKCTLPAAPGGNGNEPYPAKGSSNGAIWGHWIYYTDPNASGNGTFCNPTQFGICTPVLTR